MSSLHYLNEKLSDAIYTLTVHEGDACTRLARVLPKLKILTITSFPKDLQKDFIYTKEIIDKGLKHYNINNSPNYPLPAKLTGIRNSTARKAIEKLVKIQFELSCLLEDNKL